MGWSLTQEKIDDLLKKKGEKHKELKQLKEKSPSMLWNDDLDEFLEKLQEVEDKEIADQAESKPAKGAKGKKKTFKQETMASPSGISVAVKISDELRKKVVAAVAAKNRKASENNPVKKLEKDIVVSDDEFDGMINDKEKRKSLGEKLGFTPEKKERPAAAPKAKNGYGSSDDEFDAMVKKETPEKKNGAGNGNANSDSDSEFGAPPPAK